MNDTGNDVDPRIKGQNRILICGGHNWVAFRRLCEDLGSRQAPQSINRPQASHTCFVAGARRTTLDRASSNPAHRKPSRYNSWKKRGERGWGEPIAVLLPSGEVALSTVLYQQQKRCGVDRRWRSLCVPNLGLFVPTRLLGSPAASDKRSHHAPMCYQHLRTSCAIQSRL